MSKITIKSLGPDDAHALAPLIAEYAQALKRGAPRRPDQFYAERILGDRAAEVIGAEVDGKLVGFAIFGTLPDMLAWVGMALIIASGTVVKRLPGVLKLRRRENC